VLAALIAETPDGVIVMDDSQRMITVNRAAEQLFAYRAGALRGQQVDVLIPAGVAHLSVGGHVRTTGCDESGVRLPLDVSVSRVPLEAPTWWMLIIRDASGFTRIENAHRDSEERFRSAFDAAAIGFALTELDGRMRSVNQSLCDMIGYSASELQGMTYQSITHPDDVDADVVLARRLVAGEFDQYRMEKRFVHKRGHTVWVLLTVSLVRDVAGQPVHFIAQAAEITMFKEAERLLREHAAELERSNAELEQFAYAASHDLQVPLRTITSYAQLLRERYEDALDERGGRWLGYISDGVKHMKRLVDGLLTLARVRTDARPFASTDVRPIVQRTWDQVRSQRGEFEASCTWSELPSVVADDSQLEELFQNLLGNAVKYRRTDRPLEITVSAELRANDGHQEWQFAVRDNGIGFEQADASRIFEIFHRLHRDGEYEGTGIGLAICRRIVERHGGRIWVEASPSEGATFLFTLPLRQP
jgi:PAS domain S-box-containing protein